MLVKQVEVKLKTGLQARSAALFVQGANRFSSEILLEKDGKKGSGANIEGYKKEQHIPNGIRS